MKMEALKTYVAEQDLAEKVNEALKMLKQNKKMLALHIKYSRPAISQYLNGKYNSDATKIEELLSKWLYEEAYPEIEKRQAGGLQVVKNQPGKAEESEVPKRLKPIIECFHSTDYVQIMGVCTACQEQTKQGIIVGRPGFGKTHTLKKYERLPRVIYIAGNENMNCKDIVRRIENKIGMPRSYGSIDERTQKIIEFFNVNQGYLLIMDEADKLINKYTQKKIELLRTITDEAKLGLVLAGEPVLETLLKTYDKRFADRMEFGHRLRGLKKEEVKQYLSGYELEENALEELIRRANNAQSGSFRILNRTLNNVLRVLQSKGETKITLKVISEASDMMML